MLQDFEACYIDHVLDALVRWGDRTTETRKQILTFDQRLVKTGRRNPVGQNDRAAIGIALAARKENACLWMSAGSEDVKCCSTRACDSGSQQRRTLATSSTRQCLAGRRMARADGFASG